MDRFIIVNIIISVYCMALLTISRLAGRKISPFFGYLIYLTLIFLLLVPIVPDFVPDFDYKPHISAQISNGEMSPSMGTIEYKDLYTSVSSYRLWFYIWITGVIFELIYVAIGFVVIKSRLKACVKFNSSCFTACCERVGIRGELYAGDSIKYPFSFGILRHKVVIPSYLTEADDKTLKHIFYHELTHHRHKDIAQNYIICALRIIYWFNPLIRVSLNRLRLAMEIYCDNTSASYDGDYKEYGKTIINFASGKGGFWLVSGILGSKRDIHSRITALSTEGKNFSAELSKGAFVLICTLGIITAVTVNSFGYSLNSKYRGDIDNLSYIELSEYFNDGKGCFVLYNLQTDSYMVYNEQSARKRVSPNSTYKPFIALNALEKGIISVDSNTLSWNGSNYYFKEWNKDHNLKTAMENSVNWYFTDLDSRLAGADTESFLKTIGYGNGSIVNSFNTYWLEGSLKISPMEQARLYAQLYTNSFNCNEENIKAVINSINLGNGFYGKTGTGQVDGKTVNGWFNGVYESNGTAYGFSCRIEGGNGTDGGKALIIARNILEKFF